MNRTVLFSMVVLLAVAAGQRFTHRRPKPQTALMASDMASVKRFQPMNATHSRSGGLTNGLVVLDPGHGGSDPGTHGPDGVDEKTITLAVGRDAALELRRKHVHFIMTRDKDKYVSLPRRVAIANRNRAALFVSLHCDEYGYQSMHGFTVIYAQGASRNSRLAARLIAKGLEEQHFYCHAVRAETRHLYVLDKTNCPAVLVEMGFMSDPGDFGYLRTRPGQHRLAQGVARGIVSYLHHTKRGR